MQVYSTDGRFVLSTYDVSKFQFACADSAALAKKFALCLPSSSENGSGDIFIGGGPYYMPPRDEDQSLSLGTTPLLVNPAGTVGIQSFVRLT
ncbi:hypothetical protein L2E82_36188 [Cichorium intybus]|uniref:Uncharacterized protein n=1 Tax=Cichorium intybus TaxID=13427 RepID=A0ACB9BR01_CICIN|nr:hypothetical protein L2E82_36188 [Cichorium intybus]